ncbi:hypothetical protein B0H14DRAFT_3519442 [Mycena olivaceomarginata]|nr:hypothetical protein B0H14DRAFT_3519442 [Mycena olivaceomarginata]
MSSSFRVPFHFPRITTTAPSLPAFLFFPPFLSVLTFTTAIIFSLPPPSLHANLSLPAVPFRIRIRFHILLLNILLPHSFLFSLLLSRHLSDFHVTLPLPTHNNLSLPPSPPSPFPLLPSSPFPTSPPSSLKTSSYLSYQHPNDSPEAPLLHSLPFVSDLSSFHVFFLILGTLSPLGTRKSSELLRCCVSCSRARWS